MTRRAAAAAAALACAALPAQAAVRGVVRNATTGAPAAGVALTLSSFRDGMTPLAETVSGSDGGFAFDRDLPAVGSGQPYAGAIRAEHDGIGYTEILASGAPLDSVQITVYSASAEGIPAPSARIVLLEPGEAEMIVREMYQLVNRSQPPVTYSSADGTLRFHLPGQAQGVVQVSGTGPAGMPLTSTALPTGEEGVYKVDFPLKPGENRIDLTYLLPHEDGAEHTLRSLHGGSTTRVAAPAGVSLAGPGVQSVGKAPSTDITLYTVPDEPQVTLAVTGRPAGGGDAAGASADISIQPAPIAAEFAWIAGLALLILAAGFLHLLASERPPSAQ